MLLFHEIPDAEAIIRIKRGVFKQSKLYHRGEAVFVAGAGGFVRLSVKFGGEWGTSHPDIKVIDLPQSIPGLFVDNDGKHPPRYRE